MEFDIWVENQSKSHRFYIRRDGPWYVIIAGPIPQPDIRFSIIAGDIIHNLRSTLDHLVWQLVLRDGQEPTDRNQFPIYTSEDRFVKEVKSRQKNPERSVLYGITIDGDAWAIIEKAQPYHSPKPMANHIGILGRLSILDKHRIVCSQIGFADNISDVIRWSDDAVLLEERIGSMALSFEQQTEIVRYRFIGDSDPNVNVKGTLTIIPTLGEGHSEGRTQISIGAFPSLIDSVTAIADEIAKLPRVIDG
jgi:hypothetical protein